MMKSAGLLQGIRLVGFVAVFMVMGAAKAPAGLIYMNNGTAGLFSFEAEQFTARENEPGGHAWEPVTAPGSGNFSGASGGKYLQALPNIGDSHINNGFLPSADFAFRITAEDVGQYTLHALAQGVDGGDDSFHARLFAFANTSPGSELGSITNVDVPHVASAWPDVAWVERGFGGAPGTPLPLNEGDYVLRIYMRDDGTSIDKLVFQDSALAAPTGIGPTASLFVPEPTSGALILLLSSAALLIKPSRRRYV